MNTFGNIIGILEYLDDHSKFLAAQVSSEWRLAVKCNTKGQVFIPVKGFITAKVDDVIIHNEYNEIFIQDPLDTGVNLMYINGEYKCGWKVPGCVMFIRIGCSIAHYLPCYNDLILTGLDKSNIADAMRSLLRNYAVPIQNKYYSKKHYSEVYYCYTSNKLIKYNVLKSMVLFFE